MVISHVPISKEAREILDKSVTVAFEGETNCRKISGKLLIYSRTTSHTTLLTILNTTSRALMNYIITIKDISWGLCHNIRCK